MKQKLKCIFVGFILGLMFNACTDNQLQADSMETEEFGAIGTVEWNPLYVKIVE